MSFDALVVGGGISGLSTAHFLLRHLRAGQGADDSIPAVKVVEASSRGGGSIGTERADGFLFEHGPNGVLDNAPDTLELVSSLGLDEKLLPASPASSDRYLLRDGELMALPRSPGAFFFSKVLSVRGRLGLLCEPFRAKAAGAADESVAEFGRRRLGREAVDALLDPMVTGIYAGDVEALSMKSCFPRMAAIEEKYGSLFRGMGRKAKNKSPAGKASPFSATLHTFEDGLGTLPEALADGLGDGIEFERAAESISSCAEGWKVSYADGREEKARALILAVPAFRAAQLLSGPHSNLGRELGGISCSSVAVACLGFRAEDVESQLDGYGFLAPASEGLKTLGMIWTSSIFPGHAPQGHVSIRAMLGGTRSPEVVGLQDEELVKLLLQETSAAVGIKGEPVVQRVYRYERAIPQYEVGHQALLDSIESRLEAFPGLFLTGNSYRGVSVNDCLSEGKRTAGKVSSYLEKASSEHSSSQPPPPPNPV